MKKIRTAWVNDRVGSLGRSSAEEMEEERPQLAEALGYQINVVRHSNTMADVKETIDLLVFDYGGAANAYGESVWDEFDAMVTWAEDHPGALVLLYSSFTSRMYGELLRSKADDTGLANIMSWFIKNDIDSERVKAWFVGGEFETYEWEPIPTNVRSPKNAIDHTKTMYERVMEREKELDAHPHLTHAEIWEQAKKIQITVEAALPWVEFPDGSKQGISCFRTFCTDVFDDDGETQIGTIGGGTGFVTLSYDGGEYMIKHSDLWYAFMAALEAG